MAETISVEKATVNLSLPDRGTFIPSSDQTIWVDVSPLLNATCKDLQDGMLINRDNFNLFAAMSALEIMDLKIESISLEDLQPSVKICVNGSSSLAVKQSDAGKLRLLTP
ncbi:hypothetical protein COP2_003171 [Malus domestica]